MRVVIFCHSLVSDWNHGNAHFLRGVASELIARGHEVVVFEPRDAWSVRNLIAEHGNAPLAAFASAYPMLTSERYETDTLDLGRALEGADLVLVHEWNSHTLVQRIGEHRRAGGRYVLLFHDTHHRAVTDPAAMAAYRLEHYDGVLAFGAVIRDIYLARGWAQRAWVWHEAADTRVFRPICTPAHEGDLVWIGNWGDDERNAELREFLIGPVRDLGLRARIHGVRYPAHAQRDLAAAGIEYAGWLPNFDAPRVYGGFGVTVHVPRRPYVAALPGIPAIRVFAALACGVPLVCAPWEDTEGLFRPGDDFLMVRDGSEMRDQLATLLRDTAAAARLAAHGRRAILERHTCAHRVDALLHIAATLLPHTRRVEVAL